MEGNRTTDNCYGVVTTAPISCRSARVDMQTSNKWLKFRNLRRLKDFQILKGRENYVRCMSMKENLVLYPIQNSQRKRHSWIYFIHD